MKKTINLWLFGGLLVIGSPSVGWAASYSDIVQALETMGVADPATVKFNVSVYRSILDQINNYAQNTHLWHKDRRTGMLLGIDDLNNRLDAQMGVIGAYFESVMAPDLRNELSQAKNAANHYDYATVIRLIKDAKKELNGIQ